MKITKNMKDGYQGKHDSMRAKAEKLLDHPGSAKDVYYSKSCADKSRMRPYKEGGSVRAEEKVEHYKKGGSIKKDKDCGCPQKFAAGGVAKIRHEEATADGMPRKMKKESYKKNL